MKDRLSPNDLSVGDRVKLSDYGLAQGFGVHGNRNKNCYGTVTKVGHPHWLNVHVLRDGTKHPICYHHAFWNKAEAQENSNE